MRGWGREEGKQSDVSAYSRAKRKRNNVRLQSSADNIQRGLDLWRATVKRHETDHDSNGVPWKTAKEMYESIDSISAGGVGWTTHTLQYDGPLPDGTPPLSRCPAHSAYLRLTHKPWASYGHALGLSDWRLVI